MLFRSCSPTCCKLNNEAFCGVSRTVSPAVTVLPGQLYWIGIQCNEDKVCATSSAFPNRACASDGECGGAAGSCTGTIVAPLIRALAPGASIPITGYDINTDASLNHIYIRNTTYTATMPNLLLPVGTDQFFEGGRIPELNVVVQ